MQSDLGQEIKVEEKETIDSKIKNIVATNQGKDQSKKEQDSIIIDYSVKSDDSLISIAYHFRVAVNSIKLLNSIQEDYIYPGQILKIKVARIDPTSNVPIPFKLNNKNYIDLKNSNKKEFIKPKASVKEKVTKQLLDESSSEICFKCSLALYPDFISGNLTFNNFSIQFSPISKDPETTIRTLTSYSGFFDILLIKEIKLIKIQFINKDLLTEVYYLGFLLSDKIDTVYNNDTDKSNKTEPQKENSVISESIPLLVDSMESNIDSHLSAKKGSILFQINAQIKEIDSFIIQLNSKIEIAKNAQITSLDNDSTVLHLPFMNITSINTEEIIEDAMKMEKILMFKFLDIQMESLIPIFLIENENTFLIDLKNDDPSLCAEDNSKILNSEIKRNIGAVLPQVYRICQWNKLYSIVEDGISLNTFYNSASTTPITILLIQTVDNIVLGIFTTTKWKQNISYYGTGETLIFKVFNNRIISRKWSGQNEQFLFSDSTKIAVGGGGNFGILICNDFFKVSTNESSTFEFNGLGKYESKILNLELWGTGEIVDSK